ncbi:TMEM175 family protein [Kribbella sp. NPDC005582]|uniref:TMEM175 family protein n=1 Tax=Kribbella sp. NPDC005582 TaxID=3156893 RepID=UPI00339EB136
MTTIATSAVAPGLTSHRVGMFTDAVFAIAMTLLVIELPKPARNTDGADRMAMASELWRFLGDNAGSFLAFVVAFLMLWAAWRQHHAVFDQLDRVTPAIMFLHIPLLILVVLLPYPTALVGESLAGELVDNPLSICLFAGTEALLLLCQAALLSVVVHSGVLKPGSDDRPLRIKAIMLAAFGLFWALTAVLTWWFSKVPVVWLLSPVVATGSSKLADRLLPKASSPT